MHKKARAESARFVFRMCISCEGDGWNVYADFLAERANSMQEFVPIHFRHADIANEKVRSFRFNYHERFRTRCSRQYFRLAVFQDALDQIAGVRFVVDDKYFYPGKIHRLERGTSRGRRAG